MKKIDGQQDKEFANMDENLQQIYVTRQHTFSEKLVASFIEKVNEAEELKKTIDLLRTDNDMLLPYKKRYE